MYIFQFYRPLRPAYILHSNFLLFPSPWNRHFIFLLNFCSHSLSSLEINILLLPLSLEISKSSLWDDPVVFTFLNVCLLYLLFALLIQHNYMLPCVVKKILVCGGRVEGRGVYLASWSDFRFPENKDGFQNLLCPSEVENELPCKSSTNNIISKKANYFDRGKGGFGIKNTWIPIQSTVPIQSLKVFSQII